MKMTVEEYEELAKYAEPGFKKVRQDYQRYLQNAYEERQIKLDSMFNKTMFDLDVMLRMRGEAVKDTRASETSKHYVSPSGASFWFDGVHQFHREDGPAIIWENGDLRYYCHGRYHREDGPAYMDHSGHQEHYLFGKFIHKDLFTPEYVAMVVLANTAI